MSRGPVGSVICDGRNYGVARVPSRPIVTETYFCAHCEATVTRPYEIRSIIRTCEECGTNDRFLHQSLVDSLAALPEEQLPDDWEAMALTDQFEAALERGLIEITRK